MVWVRDSLAVYIELGIGGEMAKGEMGINQLEVVKFPQI
jgi:hypothetical protein